ncbi:MAG: hypothetical protein GY714_09705 [Desulfobacterales bacterium]|nr:hypothetical protein [Desulfobacterales bacterium]
MSFYIISEEVNLKKNGPVATTGSYYDLNKIKKLLENPETRDFTESCLDDAEDLGYPTEIDIIMVIEKLTNEHFSETVESFKNSNLMQDVYRIRDRNNDLYIKLQINSNGDGVVISFHEPY